MFLDTSYLKHKRQKMLSPSLSTYDRFGNDQQIKSEPRDKTPPHQMGSPLGVYSPPTIYEHEQQVQETAYQWGMQTQIDMSGPSHSQYPQDMQWNQNYVQMSPNMQPLSPNHPMSTIASNLQTIPTNLQTLSPNVQMSPMGPMGRISPMHGVVTPMSHVSPIMGPGSPVVGHASPVMCHGGSPGMGHISPNLVQQQQLPQDHLMEQAPSDSTSLTNLLRGDAMPTLSSDFSGLDSFLERGPDLSDSLNRLSTSDLLP